MKLSHIHLNIVNPVWWLLTFRRRQVRAKRLAGFYKALLDTKADCPLEFSGAPNIDPRPYNHPIEILDVEPERVFVLGAGA